MKFLAVSTNTKDVSPFLAAEIQRVNELRAARTITGAWVKADFSGAVLVLECADATDIVLTEIIDFDSVQPGVG